MVTNDDAGIFRTTLVGALALSLFFAVAAGTGVADLADAGDSLASTDCPNCLEGDGTDNEGGDGGNGCATGTSMLTCQ